MADADKPDKPIDDNENLVKALESIKSLLATSETKLNQARESISQASAHSLKKSREIPVLDEVIVPGTTPAESAQTALPAAGDSKTASDPQAELSAFKAELEQEMRNKLAAYAAELEAELKDKIQAYLDKHSP